MLDYFRNLLNGPMETPEATIGAIDLTVWSLTVGFILAGILIIYHKRIIGKLVRKLLAEGANSPEKAKTLRELNLHKNIFIRMSLKSETSALSKLVFEAEDDVKFDEKFHVIPTERKKRDLETARFYIPMEITYRAQIRYEKKNTGILELIFLIVIFVALAVIIVSFFPKVYEYFRGWFSK